MTSKSMPTPEQLANPLSVLLRNNRGALAFTYLLSLLEQLMTLLLPWAIGVAINDLLTRSYQGMTLFVALWVLLTGLMVGRKMYDTRIFMRIYAQLVTDVTTQQRAAGAETGRLVGRSVLIREIVDFFERDIPDVFAMVIAFVGSLVMLAVFDWRIAGVALLMLIPVLSLNGLMWRPFNRLNRSINNNLERQSQVISRGSLAQMHRHFRFLRLLKVKTSDIEARTSGGIELFVVVASLFVIIYTAQMPGIQAGTIFSVVTYFWNFQESLDRLPILMQSVSRVKDIVRRIGEGI